MESVEAKKKQQKKSQDKAELSNIQAGRNGKKENPQNETGQCEIHNKGGKLGMH